VWICLLTRRRECNVAELGSLEDLRLLRWAEVTRRGLRAFNTSLKIMKRTSRGMLVKAVFAPGTGIEGSIVLSLAGS